jgi:hypothetical protein
MSNVSQRKTTYEQKYLSVSSEFSKRAILTCRVRTFLDLFIRTHNVRNLPNELTPGLDHIFPTHQPREIWYDEAQCAGKSGLTICIWAYAFGDLVGDGFWMVGENRCYRHAVHICNGATAWNLEGGTCIGLPTTSTGRVLHSITYLGVGLVRLARGLC